MSEKGPCDAAAPLKDTRERVLRGICSDHDFVARGDYLPV